MDPASIVGVVAAAAQFAETTRKLVKLVREVHAGTEAGPTSRRLVRLETWAEVAEKIQESGAQDDPLTEKILKQCTRTVQALASHLGRAQISEGDGLRERTRKAMVARLEKDDVTELFAQLHRDQTTLLMYRGLSQEDNFLQRIRGTMGALLDERLQYSDRRGQSTPEAEFLGAIFVTDPRDDRSAIVSRKTARARGTCTWITKTEEFCDWMSTTASSPGLVVEGGPGKGKSMIAIYLTEHLEQLAQTSEGDTESVIYFFCDNRNPKQNNALAVFRCLVWQLCRLKPHLAHHGIEELKARGGAQGFLESPDTAIETLWRVFLNMLRDGKAGTVSCVIDGLDECDEASITTVLSKFSGLAAGKAVASNFRFIILSRPLIPRCLPSPPLMPAIPKIQLDPDLNEKDIVVFIEQRVDELALFDPKKPWRTSLRQKVKETLLEKAGGTFLWVGFVADDLRGRPAFEVKKRLRTLPLGLNGIYDRILRDIPPEYRTEIRSILHWVCLAEQPLLTTELAGLYDAGGSDDDSINSGTESVDSISDGSIIVAGLDKLEGLLEYCKPILKLDDKQRVHFVHQSAKDYLMQADSTDFTPEHRNFLVGDPEMAHEKLGLRCIDILEDHARTAVVRKWSSSASDDDGDEISGSEDGDVTLPEANSSASSSHGAHVSMSRGPCTPSFDYATHNWTYHIKNSGTVYHDPRTSDRVLQVIDKRGDLRRVWLDAFAIDYTRSDSRYDSYRDKDASGLELGIAYGLGATVRELILPMSLEDYCDARNTTRVDSFLKVAIRRRQSHIVTILFDHFGEELASRDPGSLSEAVTCSADQTIKFLLALGPSPRERHGDDLDMALNTALFHVQKDRVIELHNVGARFDTKTARFGGSFQALARNRNLLALGRTTMQTRTKDLAQWLLARGADPTFKDGHGHTALHFAAANCMLDYVVMLVEAGAPVNDVNSWGRTPLHELVRGHISIDNKSRAAEVAALLIRAGQAASSQTGSWSIDHQDKDGRSALHWAAKQHWWAVVKILLKAGSDANLRDRKGKSPFMLTLDELAGLISDKHGIWLLLSTAMTELDRLVHGALTSIDVLSMGGANVDAQDGKGRTVLHMLAQMMRQVPVGLPSIEYCLMLEVLDAFRGLGVDEGLRDAAGKTARDRYPEDHFWMDRTIERRGSVPGRD